MISSLVVEDFFLAFDIGYSFNSTGNKPKFSALDYKLLSHISTLELGK